MPTEVRVPTLGESIVEATIGRWLKSEGDVVASGDPLVELETDKVNVEVPADQSGILQQIAHAQGETVNVGELLAILADVPAGSSALASPPRKESSDPASRNGETKSQPPDDEEAAITPVARRLAAENNIDTKLLTGTGPNSRITKEDVTSYIEGRAPVAVTVAAPSKEQPKEPAKTQPVEAAPQMPVRPPTQESVPPADSVEGSARREERVRMSRRRQTIAARLVEAQHTAAMLTTFNEIDMSAVMEIRKRRKDSFKERYGVGLGFMSFFTKAVVGALKAFPRLNAELQGDEMVLKHYYDIGIAVGAEEGLVVPVVRDADRLSFAEIEREIGALAAKARENKLTLSELKDGTFTITNGGTFGSMMSTPILNAPQVGILGMHKIEERPVVVGGEIVARPMMYVALSYDHRIVDGSEAVRFLVKIKELIEDPETLLLEG